MRYLLGAILISLAGSVVVVSGTSMDVASIFNTSKQVASEANLHQIRTALKVYYLEQGHYPKVNLGDELIDLLESKSYISDKPGEFTDFEYAVLGGGWDYELSLEQ